MLVYCKVGELFTDDGKRQRLSRSGKRPRLHLEEEEEDETGAGSKRADVDYSIVGGVLGVAKSGPTGSVHRALVEWIDAKNGECSFEDIDFLTRKVPDFPDLTREYFIQRVPIGSSLTVTMKVS